MLKRLLGRTPIDVWVIKQVDADLLHLCGRATLAAKPNRKAVHAALERGEFSGAVTMATGGMVLNSRLFRALIPAEALQLLPDGQACWQGRDWLLSQVPQRCWTFEGRLVARPDPTGSGSLVSVEDVTGIRRQVDRSTPHASRAGRLPSGERQRGVSAGGSPGRRSPGPQARQDRSGVAR